MAIVPINIGVSANDNSGDPLRTAFDKLNTSISELDTRVTTLEGAAITVDNILRSSITETADGTSSQVITYSSSFTATCGITIIDTNGLGIEVIAQSATGFTIKSLAAGTFGYTALIIV